ncbi:MAG TPA: DUF3105 domain-containing protein [Candidatus Dormibacteraeota bacterium]
MSRSQRDLKAMRQAQREEAAARQRGRDRRNLLIIGAGLASVAVAIIVVAAILNNQAKVAQANRIKFQAVTTPVGQLVADEGTASHIDPATTATYKFYPPTSGPHYNVQGFAPVAWQTISTLQEGQFVHNLEHGGIAILYNCPSGNACTTLTGQLENYVKNLAPAEPSFNKVKLVMTPYSKGMQKKIALVAWHYVDFLDSYDQNEITRFYENHVDHGPEQIP